MHKLWWLMNVLVGAELSGTRNAKCAANLSSGQYGESFVQYRKSCSQSSYSITMHERALD